MSAKSFSFPTQSLARWYQKFKRDLPWRKNPTPYFVWISEIMLQQTQVQTVLPYYHRFLKRFPTLKALASASEQEVLALWSGLGYYSRARNLHRAATMVEEKHKGKFPSTKGEILELPGIGAYTAGAILSIAFHQAVPILDGNVKRILSRFYLETAQSSLWELAETLVTDAQSRAIDPSDFNQALMELGALVCLPEHPQCLGCPLQNDCLSKKEGVQHLYPPKEKINKTVRQTFALFVISEGNQFLLRHRSNQERQFKNMWEFPMVSTPFAADKEKAVREFREQTGFSVEIKKSYPYFAHSITHHRLKIWPFMARFDSKNGTRKGNGFKWIPKDKIKTLSSSSILSKTLARMNDI